MCKCVLLVLFSLNVCVCSLHNCCVCEHVREEESMVSVSALISKHSLITGLHELFKQKSHQQMCLLLRRGHQYLLHLWLYCIHALNHFRKCKLWNIWCVHTKKKAFIVIVKLDPVMRKLREKAETKVSQVYMDSKQLINDMLSFG